MVVGFSSAHALPAKTSPVSNKSYGDGGGYKHPDAVVGQFFETKSPSPAEIKPKRLQVPAKVTPEIQLVGPSPTVIASRPRPRPFAPVTAKTGDVEGRLDSASEDARRDYETRLLGAAPAPRRAGLADSQVMPLTKPALSTATGEGMLFVSLELDPKEAGTLRDAVAGLGLAAAFRPDARFQPLPGEGGLVRISGWLPVSRLGAAIARPGVTRVMVERGSFPMGNNSLTGDYILKLRVSDAARPEESIAASVLELTVETGFKLDRVFAVETVSSGGAIARVSGTLPISRLARALALAGVIEINSVLPGSTPAAASDSSAAAGSALVQKEGFLKFVMARNLGLVLLTVLLALAAFGRILKRGLAVFVPYR